MTRCGTCEVMQNAAGDVQCQEYFSLVTVDLTGGRHESSTSEKASNTLHGLSYDFYNTVTQKQETGSTFQSTAEVIGSSIEIQYQLSAGMYSKGFRISGVKWVSFPKTPGNDTGKPNTLEFEVGFPGNLYDQSVIDLVDLEASDETGHYSFLLEFCNVNDTIKATGKSCALTEANHFVCPTGCPIYRSPDPTIYNPPDGGSY